jgi:hypothetical protein
VGVHIQIEGLPICRQPSILPEACSCTDFTKHVVHSDQEGSCGLAWPEWTHKLANARAEMVLTIFAYNIKRTIRILGVQRMIEALHLAAPSQLPS